MGIVNVTPDSFSDGGRFDSPKKAVEQAKKLVCDGAKIIDVGGESTRPNAVPVDEDVEIERIAGVVENLASEGICVSVDTRHAKVAKVALDAGASIINDVSGFVDPEMRRVVKKSDCGLIVMHMRGTPQTMQNLTDYDDVVNDVCNWLKNACIELENGGIDRARICIDPGPGFAKTPHQTLEVMRNIHEFVHLGYPVMAAPSRKRYLKLLMSDDQQYDVEDKKDEFTALECRRAAELGACVFRVHNVKKCLDELKDLRPYVILSLGSNVALVGESKQEQQMSKISQINLAIQEILSLPDTDLIDVSGFYESKAAYVEDQDDFVNCAVVLRCGVAPLELLDYLHLIENSLGRVREVDKGPRTIDIDIVDYQMYVCESEKLTLPHKLATERDFVVEPICEILPTHILSNGVAIDSICKKDRIGQCKKII